MHALAGLTHSFSADSPILLLRCGSLDPGSQWQQLVKTILNFYAIIGGYNAPKRLWADMMAIHPLKKAADPLCVRLVRKVR